MLIFFVFTCDNFLFFAASLLLISPIPDPPNFCCNFEFNSSFKSSLSKMAFPPLLRVLCDMVGCDPPPIPVEKLLKKLNFSLLRFAPLDSACSVP